MADISKITASNGTVYDIKDATARANIKTYTAGTGLSLSGTEFSVKTGYTTSGNNRKVQADSSGNLYVTQKDDNTTYSMTRDGSSVKLTPSSGTAQSIPLSDLINGLSEGTSPAQTGDYLVAQYVGGGTSNTGYYRRTVGNVVNSTVVKAALGTGSGTTKYLREDGTWQAPSYPTVNNATLTIQKNGTNVQTFTANQGTNATANITVPTKTSELTNNSNFVTSDNATPYEAKLRWGGQNFTGSYGCIDAAMIDELGANRLAFTPDSAITIEYSRDGGSTWTDYGATVAEKRGLFSNGTNVYIGKADSSHKATANGSKYQLRITLNTGIGNIYTVLNKFIFYINTSGSASCTVTIQKALESTPNTYIDVVTNVNISGWSGYNVVNVDGFATYGNTAASQYGRLRFIFKANGGDTKYIGLSILKIMGFGGVGWTTPSTMAKLGHLYSYDCLQNATFPAGITATSFSGDVKGNISQATGLTKTQVTNALGYTPPTKDTNTTYTFANGTNGFTVTPSGGTAQTVTVTPSITNNVTGTGTTNKVAKFTGAHTIGDGYSVDTTVTSGSSNLTTSGAVYTASNKGGIELTQAQYDALPNSKLTDGINYFITDNNNPNTVKASQIIYENSGSELDSTNVQEAIDELNSLLYTRTVTKSQTTLPITSSYVTSGTIVCYKKGSTLAIKADGLKFSTFTGRITIGTAPAGYRPEFESTGMFNSTTTTFGIRASGELWVEAGASGKQLWGMITTILS